MGRWWATMATIAVLLVGGWMFYREAWTASRGGVDSPLYSAERYDPYGTAALYRLLERQGHPVRRLERPRLADDLSGILIEVLPSDPRDDSKSKSSPHAASQPGSSPHQAGDEAVYNATHLPMDEVLDWVSRGNVLIQLCRSRTAIMDKAGIPRAKGPSLAHAGALLEKMQVRGAFPSELTVAQQARWTAEATRRYGLSGLGPTLRAPQTFGMAGRTGWAPLATVHGRVVAGEIPFGRGRIVVIGAPTPALNEALAKGGNLSLMLGLIGERPVIFDAWAHHLGQAGTLMGLIRRFGLWPVLLQLALLVLVYRWSTRGRRGEAPPVPMASSSVKQIDTLGHLYEQAMDERQAVARAAAEVRRRVAAGLRCPVSQIERKLERVDPDTARRARDLLTAMEQVVGRWSDRCHRCGYDLRGSSGSLCPECGAPIPTAARGAKPSEPGTVGSSGGRGGDVWRADRQRVLLDLARLLTISHDFAEGTHL